MTDSNDKKPTPKAGEPAILKIGRYEILRELGRGAMGIVYEAVDPVIKRKVALKTIRFDRFSSGEELAELRARFQHEAQAAGGLSQPNIVTIYDIGMDQEATFIAMEFIEGESLERLMATKRKWPLERVIALVCQIGEALDYAHRKGIIHRDIKPANILVDRAGRPRIVDFGIARLSSSTMTRTSMSLGTPSYMAPEQISGQKVDQRADVFSLGVILYEMLTYQKPFAGSDVTTIIFKIMQQDPPLPRAIEKDIPTGLEYVIMKALAKNPEDRYQNCWDFITDLTNYRKYENREIPKSVITPSPAEAGPAAVPETSAPSKRTGGNASAEELTDTVHIPKPAARAASAGSPVVPAAVKKFKPIVPAAVLGGIAIIVAAVLLFGPFRAPKAGNSDGAAAVEKKPAPPLADASTAKTEPISKDAAASKSAAGAQKPAAPGGASQDSKKAESPVRIYTIPKILKMVEAVYPAKAKKDRIEGLIVLEVTADGEGRVTNAKILRSIPALDQAAIQAVRQWRYDPQIIRGRPRAFICSATVNFKLK